MPAKAPVLYPSALRLLAGLGERLRTARLRRALSAETVCARADISRPTLSKIEQGDASVTLGNYLQVLRVLGLDGDLATLASDDVVGRRLQDAGLSRSARAPRRKKAGPAAPEPGQTGSSAPTCGNNDSASLAASSSPSAADDTQPG
jgi:transcriptional regulator with XRE-family HTH domain